MSHIFVVRRGAGPQWNKDQSPLDQPLWQEHADFMRSLAADGFVLVGGELEGDASALLIVQAESEKAVHERLASDPWSSSGLSVTKSVNRWNILINAENLRVNSKVDVTTKHGET